jgi:glycosyltransferase involved in cell wall biosynthesis
MSLPVIVDGIIYQLQPHGGIARLFCEVLPRIRKLDKSIRIVLFTDRDAALFCQDLAGITPMMIPRVERYLRPRRLWKPLVPLAKKSIRTLWLGLGQRRIWHSTYYTQPDYWKGKLVVTVVDMIHERFLNLFDKPEDAAFRERKRQCVERADAVICISETTRQDLETFYDIRGDHIYVIPLACSEAFKALPQEVSKKGFQGRHPFLLYVGDRNHYKNFARLVRSYAAWQHTKEVSLYVVGRPWSIPEKALISELKIEQFVRLITDLDDEGLCRLYHQAVALVYPSLYEGFGIPLLEAMRCGCPIVASRIPSTLEVAGTCPIYFEPEDEFSLMAAFNVALSEGRNPARVDLGIENANRYSWDNTARQTLRVYNRMREEMSRVHPWIL